MEWPPIQPNLHTAADEKLHYYNINEYNILQLVLTATLYQIFETYIPRDETVRPMFPISTFMYLGAMYIFP
jgi:hypothetical protein